MKITASSLGHDYKLLGETPYTRLDGTETVVWLWQATCAVCGASHIVMAPAEVTDASRFARTCLVHRGKYHRRGADRTPKQKAAIRRGNDRTPKQKASDRRWGERMRRYRRKRGRR